MTNRELAEKYGASIRTIARYRSAGVDLSNQRAVEAHMFEQRSRRGISKFFRRSATVAHRAVTIATQNAKAVIEDLESRICGVHSELEHLVKHHPELALQLADAFDYIAPVVERIGAEE